MFTVISYVTVSISGLTISNGSNNYYGGGVSNSGNLSLTNVTLSGNSAYYGGGVYNAGTATLTNVTISGNSATEDNGIGWGGGLFNTATATLTNVTISGNSAGDDGGGVLNDSFSTATLTNVTISGNSANVDGGGVCNSGNLSLTNVTISGNSAGYAGGVYNSGGTATLNNTIVANSTSGGAIVGSVIGYNNLIGDAANAGGLTNGVDGNIVGVNPLLGTLGSYGGRTQTIPLLPGSPAIGAGSIALAVDGSGSPLTTDQRGTASRTLNGMVDIGAFEDQISGTAPGSQNATQGVSGSFTLGSFSDQATPSTSWSVDVSWGDGSTDTTLLPTSQGSLGSASHTYNTAGPETVTVTVADSYDDVCQYSFSVNVLAPTSIAVTPAIPSVAKGLTQQFTATGTYADGSTADLTNLVTWASATPSVATISSTGLAQSLATGTTNITATLGSVTSPTDTLTVTAAVLTSIAVAPASPSVAKGLAQQFTATGTYTDGSTANLTSQVTWASATTSVATVSNASGSQGLAHPGRGDHGDHRHPQRDHQPERHPDCHRGGVTSIAVAPVNPSVAKGLTQQFSATGTYTDGTTANLTSQVTWDSATPSIVTISSTGLAQSLATGTTNITAALGSVTSPTDTLTVTAAG